MNTTVIVVIFVAVAALFYFLKIKPKDVMDPNEFREKVKDNPGVIIDVRTSKEYAKGHLKKTDYNLDVMSGEFQRKLDSLDKNETYYLYCRSGNRSGKAANIMKQNGFNDVYNIGAFPALVRAGFEKE